MVEVRDPPVSAGQGITCHLSALITTIVWRGHLTLDVAVLGIEMKRERAKGRLVAAHTSPP